jgi:hypothetical protein
MYSFKKSLIAFTGLLVIFGAIAALTPLASRGQGPSKQRGLRKFYLTQGKYDGSQSLLACAEGYHMPSLWEIVDPSNLSYDTNLGVTVADAGSGPPSAAPGWIRTGFLASGGSMAPDGSVQPGTANCQAWTSASSEAHGTIVSLPIYAPVDIAVSPIITPWVAEPWA